MEKATLIQHFEVIIIWEESSTNADGNRVILDIYPMMKGEKKKVNPWSLPTNQGKRNANIGKNLIAKKKSVFGTKNKLKEK
jgi:hypothetical protein